MLPARLRGEGPSQGALSHIMILLFPNTVNYVVVAYSVEKGPQFRKQCDW